MGDGGTGVSMVNRAVWCAVRAPGRRLGLGLGVLVALGLGLAVAGCTTDGGGAPGMATASVSSRGPTVAFESIDGPPVGVFQKLVVDLSEEAQSRQIQVVSREAPASYRVRGFLALNVVSGRPHVAWVWDIYDADKRRALRISGEELSAHKISDAWGAADDLMLRHIARTSIERIVTFLAAPAPAPGSEPIGPAPARPAVASTDDLALPNAMALASTRP